MQRRTFLKTTAALAAVPSIEATAGGSECERTTAVFPALKDGALRLSFT